MLPPGTALLSLLLVAGSLGQGARRPSRPLSPINTIQPKANFDAQQEQFYRAEATTLHAAPQGTAMAVNTLRKLDGICWEVRQLYSSAKVPGRFLLQARGAKGPVHVVVGEIDYQGFAVVYLERARRLSVKLYARSLPVSDSALSAFERAVQRANLTEEYTYFFPKYGFCETADQFHILNEVRR